MLLRGNGGFEQLEIRDDVAVPSPGPGQVLVKVAAAGVNNTDINTRLGWYTPDVAAAGTQAVVGWSGDVPAFPRIQGADACGRIVSVAADVDSSRIGERIIVSPVFREPGEPMEAAVYFGSRSTRALNNTRCHATRRAMDCVRTDVELASRARTGGREHAVRAAVVAGETVVVTGASGGGVCRRSTRSSAWRRVIAPLRRPSTTGQFTRCRRDVARR